MKTCIKCGFNDFKPKKKCPQCGQKYGNYFSCDPLSASTQRYDTDMQPDCINGFITTGDPNAKHNKD